MPACEATDSVPAYPPSFVVEEQSWEAPLRHGSAATSSASMMSQSELSKCSTMDRHQRLPRGSYREAVLSAIATLEAEAKKRLVAKSPLGVPWIEPEAIAPAVVFLA